MLGARMASRWSGRSRLTWSRYSSATPRSFRLSAPAMLAVSGLVRSRTMAWIALIWCAIRSDGTTSRSGACSMILHRLSAAAPAEGYPNVAASPLMSWAARNSSARAELVKPSLRIAACAAASRSASIPIQFLNSPDRPARAFSARATGSSRSFSTTRRNTLRSGLGCVMTVWSAKVSIWSAAGLSFAIMVSLGRLASNGGPGLVEQRGLLKDFHLAADAALGADIGLGADERARIGDYVENALVKPLGRNRLGEEFGHTGVARDRHAAFF